MARQQLFHISFGFIDFIRLSVPASSLRPSLCKTCYFYLCARRWNCIVSLTLLILLLIGKTCRGRAADVQSQKKHHIWANQWACRQLSNMGKRVFSYLSMAMVSLWGNMWTMRALRVSRLVSSWVRCTRRVSSPSWRNKIPGFMDGEEQWGTPTMVEEGGNEVSSQGWKQKVEGKLLFQNIDSPRNSSQNYWHVTCWNNSWLKTVTLVFFKVPFTWD